MSLINIFNCDPSSVVGSTFIALVGCFVSYKLGRHNHRIDDFNKRRDTIVPMLKSEIEDPNADESAISEDEFDILFSLMYPWRKNGFRNSFEAYKAARSGEKKIGEWPGVMVYKDPEPVSAAAAKLLTYLKRR